MESAEGYM
jgi:hypothetical protein